MLLSDYIKSKLARYSVTISDNELAGLLLKSEIETGEEYSASTSQKADLALYAFIPELLLMPAISQGGFSIKYDREGILAYYRMLCSDLNLPDKTAATVPNVKDMSRRFW
ncbi:MAG TPA: DUF6706 family protein [Emticicia sp.]